MPEAAKRGHALRVYQVAALLLLGWFAGRIPGLLQQGNSEKQALTRAVSSPAGPSAAGSTQAVDSAFAADVAARVAAQVAERTVAQLLAAGWAPPGGTAPLIPAAPQSSPAARPAGETVLRIVTETPPLPQGGLAWSLPPAALAAAPAAGPAADAPGSAPGSAAAAGGSAAASPTPAAEQAHATATAGYAALRAGDRRQAAALLDRAVAMDSGSAEAHQWQADSEQLKRRLSIAGYVVSRSGGPTDPLAASPVLGGGQAGLAAGYVLDPLSRQRVSVVGRLTAASKAGGAIDGETTEAALGVRLQPFADIPIAIDAERRFALGLFSRNAWAGRISGGGVAEPVISGRRFRIEGYGEAGVIGFRQRALYAGGQMRGGTALFRLGRAEIDGGAGLWGATQRDYGRTVSRLDVGPSAQVRLSPWPFRAQVDYRLLVAGNASPKSGPVVTVAGEF